MDAVSYSHSAKQAQRIEKFIKNPDSNSGIVTVPKVIGAGESVTIPAGRVAVLPNVQVDGILNVEGEVFIPSGSTFGDLEEQIDERQLKSELAYNVNTSSYIPNTLASGAIIERGSNVNGEYVKFADGTLICFTTVTSGLTAAPSSYIPNMTSYTMTLTLPSSYVGFMPGYAGYSGDSYNQGIVHAANGGFFIYETKSTSFTSLLLNITWIGRWK